MTNLGLTLKGEVTNLGSLEVKARAIYDDARATLGDDLGGGSLRDLLCDNMVCHSETINLLVERIRRSERKTTSIDGTFISRSGSEQHYPPLAKAWIPAAVLDSITRDHTAFGSFDDLLNTPGNYRPTLDVGNMAVAVLADAYDATMMNRADPRRAFRRT